MRIVAVRHTRFSIPFRHPVALAHGGRAVAAPARRGVLIEVIAADGEVGIGEAAPHPALPVAALAAVEEAMRAAVPSLVGLSLAGRDDPLERVAAVGDPHARAALGVALCDLAARARGNRLAELLAPVRRERVPVNTMLDEVEPEVAAAAARRAVQEGFTCLKLKTGGQDLETLVERVRAVRAAVGTTVRIRVDANGEWTVERAIDAASRLSVFDLEYVEQPVAGLDGMAAVRRAVGVPLAADEIVVDAESVARIAAARAADVVVVKPAFLGLGGALSVARKAEEHGLEVVVTSALDTSIGIAAALHLAATVEGGKHAAGLATASLLTADLACEPLLARRGEIALPAGPGLGVRLDRAALGRWQI